MEREGLFGLMDDLNNGRTVSLQPLDLPRIFAEHAARESYLRHRDAIDERYHAAVARWTADGEEKSALAEWLAGA